MAIISPRIIQLIAQAKKDVVTHLSILSLACIVSCSKAPPTEVLHQIHTDNGAYASALSQAGLYAAVSTQNGVLFWDTEKNQTKYVWNHKFKQNSQIHLVEISHDSQAVLTADRQNFAIWNINTGANKGFYSIDESSITSAKISNQGRFVALGLLNGKVIHINVETGRRIEFLGHTDRITQIAMSANGAYVLSGGYEGMAYLWNSKTGQVRNKFTHTGRISQVALDNQARYAFTANSMNQSWIWDLTTGKKITELKYPVRQQIFSSVVFSNNGEWLATGAPNQKVKLWSVKSGELLAEWPFEADSSTASVLDFAFSLDDNFLSAETSFGILQKWQIQGYLAKP